MLNTPPPAPYNPPPVLACCPDGHKMASWTPWKHGGLPASCARLRGTLTSSSYYNIILKAILTLSLPKSTTSVRIRPTRRAPYPPLLFLGLSVLWGDSRARPWLESKGATTIRSVVYHINEYYELTEPADTRNGAVNAICSRRAHPPPSTLPHE